MEKYFRFRLLTSTTSRKFVSSRLQKHDFSCYHELKPPNLSFPSIHWQRHFFGFFYHQSGKKLLPCLDIPAFFLWYSCEIFFRRTENSWAIYKVNMKKLWNVIFQFFMLTSEIRFLRFLFALLTAFCRRRRLLCKNQQADHSGLNHFSLAQSQHGGEMKGTKRSDVFIVSGKPILSRDFSYFSVSLMSCHEAP